MSIAKRSKRRRYIDILGVRVKIKYQSKDMYDDDDQLLDGAYCAETSTIHVSTKSDVPSTIMHEATHAALEISGVNKMFGMKLEESIVSAIENGLKNYFKF